MKGNAGGPGNPFSRNSALLRKAAQEALDPERIQRIMTVMAEKAEKGDATAASFVFAYAIGKPTGVVDPDKQDLEEYEQLEKEREIQAGMLYLGDCLNPGITLATIKAMRDEITEAHLERMQHQILSQEAPTATPQQHNDSPFTNGDFGSTDSQTAPTATTQGGENAAQTIPIPQEGMTQG